MSRLRNFVAPAARAWNKQQLWGRVRANDMLRGFSASASQSGIARRRGSSYPSRTVRFFSGESKAVALSKGDPKAKEIAIAGGNPEAFVNHKVTIFKPSRVATQQGAANTEKWHVKFDREDGQRWVNPLMGWQAAREMTSQLSHLVFDTKEEAVEYCQSQGATVLVMPFGCILDINIEILFHERRPLPPPPGPFLSLYKPLFSILGLEYELKEPNIKKKFVKSYASNFKYKPAKKGKIK